MSCSVKSAVKGMFEITNQIMKSNHITNDNLKLFIAHQANKRIIDATAKNEVKFRTGYD